MDWKMTKYKLISGKEYSLSQLLGSQHILSIPDLQRDYCWGVRNLASKDNEKEQDEIVSSFLDSIITQATQDGGELSSTGLIYAYEWPKGTYQLCDGQQRITTLFLLAGILCRRCNNNELKQVIQRTDSIRKCYSALQYGIRETSLHFLDDLVANYFLRNDYIFSWRSNKTDRENKGALVSNARPDWYYLEYDNDPTIQAMLCALCLIEERVRLIPECDLERIINYILHNITFIFYDMESRSKGEETFVVINNTGEPLTSTENLKPQLIGSLDDDLRKKYVEE